MESRRTVQAFLILNTIGTACAIVFVVYNFGTWDFTFVSRNRDRIEAAALSEIRSSVERLIFLILIPLGLTSAISMFLAWWTFAKSNGKS